MFLIAIIAVYTVQIGLFIVSALFLPVIIKLITGNKRVFYTVTLFSLLAEIMVFHFLLNNPIFVCPKEYGPYVSLEETQTIISINKGIYSRRMPLVAFVIHVTNADENSITVQTSYLFFGHRLMELTSDGIFVDNLF